MFLVVHSYRSPEWPLTSYLHHLIAHWIKVSIFTSRLYHSVTCWKEHANTKLLLQNQSDASISKPTYVELVFSVSLTCVRMTRHISHLLNSWKEILSSRIYHYQGLHPWALSLETTCTREDLPAIPTVTQFFKWKGLPSSRMPSALPPPLSLNYHLGREALRQCQKLLYWTLGVTMWQHPKMKLFPQSGDQTRMKGS